MDDTTKILPFAAPNPFDPAALRLNQSFTDGPAVKKLLTMIPVRKPVTAKKDVSSQRKRNGRRRLKPCTPVRRIRQRSRNPNMISDLDRLNFSRNLLKPGKSKCGRACA
jgi:hypothetical protein